MPDQSRTNGMGWGEDVVAIESPRPAPHTIPDRRDERYDQNGPSEIERDRTETLVNNAQEYAAADVDQEKIGPYDLDEDQETAYESREKQLRRWRFDQGVDPFIEGEAAAMDLDPHYAQQVRDSDAKVAEAMARREKDLAQLRYARRHPRKARLRHALRLKPGEYTEPVPKAPKA